MHQIQPVLYASLRSPFARRIRLALYRLGVSHEIRMVDVFQENSDLNQANPLGLVPTLISEHGPITDSQHLLEYLDETHGSIWNQDPRVRFQERQASVWAAGIMQSSVLYFQELKLHEVPSPRWLHDHQESIRQTLIHLETLPQEVWVRSSSQLSQAGWDLAVALEYLSLRIPELDWSQRHPFLRVILEKARESEEFIKTAPTA